MRNKEKNKSSRRFYAMIIVVVVSLFMVSFVNAAEFDNFKYQRDTTFDGEVIEGNKLLEKYKPIEIKNMFGLGSTLFEGYLTQHDEECGTNCQSTIKIKTGKDGILIDDIIFKTLMDDGSWIEQSIKSYQFYIQDGTKKIDVEDTESVCETKENIKSCRTIITGTHQEEVPKWTPYNIGDSVKEGTYTIKLEGEKSPTKTVDWIIKTNGEWLESWADWVTSNLVDNITNYYKFDEQTGPIVDSAGTVNGTGTNLVNTTGKINTAYNFTTGAFMNMGDNIEHENISIQAWVYTNASGVPTSVVVSKSGAAEGYFIQIINNAGWVLRVCIYTGSTVCAQDTAVFTKNTFHHIVATYNGTVIRLWKDGVNVANASQTGPILYGSVDLNIGRNPVGSDPFMGTIDEVAFWNQSLSQSQILQLYNSGNALAYPFSQGSVTLNSPQNSALTTDIVTFNATATLSGGSTIVNMSLYTNESGVWEVKNTTTGLSGADETHTWTRTLERGQSYFWNVLACDSDGDCGFSTDNRTFSVDEADPQISIEAPNNTIDYNFIGGNETLNVTFTETNLDTCWFNYNGTNITIDGCLTGVKNSTQFILEEDNLNMTVYANDTVGNENSTFINWSYNLLANSIVFSNEARSGALENFTINVTIADKFTGVSMLLNYNGTNHSMTSESSNHTRTYTTQLIVPAVSTDTNITLFFIATLSEGENITIISTDEENQTVSPFLIDDCSLFTNTLLSFEMVDEDSLSEINGTIEITLDIFSIGTSDLVNTFNTSFDYLIGQDSEICLENITESYSMSYQIRHFGDADQYFKKYRNVQMTTISNETLSQNITLFNLNISRGNAFNVIVVGNLLTSVGNAGLLVDTQRQYLATNEFRSVESPITDSSGVAISNLVETEEIYNFLISFDGELLGTFNNFQVKCANAALGQCSITLNLATATGEPTDFETFGNITQVFLLQTSTNTLHHTFSSTDGTSKTVRSLVIQNDGYANKTVCDSSTSGTSGTILCPIAVAFQNVSICAQTFVNEEMVGTRCFTQGPDINWQGADILIMLLMFSSLVLLFLAHPITIILGAILGLAIPVIFITSAEASLGPLFGAVLFYIAGGIVAIIIIAKKKN